MRTPRPSSSTTILPPDLIGSSSRQLRKAISVPLATAQTGESARQRRDRERLGETGVSVMISPYGRRRQVDQASRDARRTEERESGEAFNISSAADVRLSPIAELVTRQRTK